MTESLVGAHEKHRASAGSSVIRRSSGGQHFGARVQRAKLVEESPDGALYQKELWARVGNHAAAAMQSCFPRNVKADTTAFTLVGDVNRECHLDNVVVQPSTPMSRCFASAFSAAQFPELPEAFQDHGVPLVIEMKVTP
jgi:hypothetical protein